MCVCVCVCVCVMNISEVEINLSWSRLGRGLTFVESLICAGYLCQVLCISGSQLGVILSLWGCLAMSGDTFGCHIWGGSATGI